MTDEKQYPHAHVQFEGQNLHEDCVRESMIGFNPGLRQDREFCHELLDEYLDLLCKHRKDMIDKGETEKTLEGIGFRVYNYLDMH